MIPKDSKTLTLKPSLRKSRSKIRKPKFLSLRLQLSSAAAPPLPPSPSPMPTTTINLFPLHPENLTDQDNMAACMFSSCDDDGAATTLTGILCSDEDEEEENTNNPSPSSVNFADEEGELVRTAMRRHKTERDNYYDERWVCYSQVVEKKKGFKGFLNSPLTSSSSSCNHDYEYDHKSERRNKLVLKLDYEKIMKSWVNKGPLYIQTDSDPCPGMGMDSLQPQIVPDLQDDDVIVPSSATALGMKHEGLWTVPEMINVENNKGDEETCDAMMHHREASVQRYKEKRRNRLFAKTIRYQVRKLNAEKRPRVKGRFVKRN